MPQYTAEEMAAREAQYARRYEAHRAAGRKLREARARLGLTPREVALLIGRRTNSVKCWEGGSVQPGQQSRAMLCKVLHLEQGEMDALWDFPRP